MTGLTLPNLGLVNGFADGENGWGPSYNANVLAVDVLFFLTVLDTALSAPPVSPAAGDRYVIPATPAATQAWLGRENHVACFYAGVWHFYVPRRGWVAFSLADNADHRFDGTTWAGQTKPYDIPAYIPGFDAGVSDPLFSVLMRRRVRLPAGFAGSAAVCRAVSPAAVSLPVFVNAAQIGTVDFAARSVVATFTLATETTLNTDDVLSLYPPSPVDATMRGVSVTFVGYR